MTADIIDFPTKNRSNWTGWDEYLFDHLRQVNGLSAKDASARVDREIISRNVPDTGYERSVRLAREALHSLAPIKK